MVENAEGETALVVPLQSLTSDDEVRLLRVALDDTDPGGHVRRCI